ncbi:MAG: hypothetical protein AAGE92_11675 [Cyanobacteria bacterium P01_G01_bin.4]
MRIDRLLHAATVVPSSTTVPMYLYSQACGVSCVRHGTLALEYSGRPLWGYCDALMNAWCGVLDRVSEV